jgi:hypothetical protein
MLELTHDYAHLRRSALLTIKLAPKVTIARGISNLNPNLPTKAPAAE